MFGRTQFLGLGIIIGLLVAPKPGAETRRDLARWWSTQVGKSPAQWRGNVNKNLLDASHKASSTIVDTADKLHGKVTEVAKNIDTAASTFTSMNTPASATGGEKPAMAPEGEKSSASPNGEKASPSA